MLLVTLSELCRLYIKPLGVILRYIILALIAYYSKTDIDS